MRKCLVCAGVAAVAAIAWAMLGIAGVASGCDDDLTRSFEEAWSWAAR